MRRSTLVLTAVGIAAAGFAGSAFTASNDLSAGNKYVGYGEATLSGATASAINYTAEAADNTYLDHVAFTLTNNITGQTATMTLKSGTSPVGTSPYTCSITTPWASGSLILTCGTTMHVAFNTFDAVGLTVLN